MEFTPLNLPLPKTVVPLLSMEGALRSISSLASTQSEAADITRRHCITCNPPALHIACMVKQEVSATGRFPCRVSEGSGGGRWTSAMIPRAPKTIQTITPRLPVGAFFFFKDFYLFSSIVFVQAKLCPLTLNESKKTNAKQYALKT